MATAENSTPKVEQKTTTRAILVGESPNEATVDKPGLWLRPTRRRHHSGSRMLAHTGWDESTYLLRFLRTNSLPFCPPRAGKGRQFPVPEARKAAPALWSRHCEPDAVLGPIVLHRVLLVGRRQVPVYRWYDGETDARIAQCCLEPFTWAVAQSHSDPTCTLVRACWVPHPSGVNRWWNHGANRRRARAFFSRLLTDLETEDEPCT